VLGVLILPGVAQAQSAFAGTVRDTSGGVLPGVTVEASSPALIDKVRTATTDATGQYRLVDLRPGTYTVTFSLAGFTIQVREGIRLEADFTAPLNIEMRIGTLEESVTVTGASPVVDVQRSTRREVLTGESLDALPTGRAFYNMANSLPSITTGGFDVGGSSTLWHGGSLAAHGSANGDSRVLIDGMVADGMHTTGQCACVYDNEMQTEEIAVSLGAGDAESQLSGVLINRIPKTGSNRFSGDQLLTFSNSAVQGSNLTDALRARGVTSPAELYKQYDVTFSLSGPIVRDRLWFFFSGRHWGYNEYVLGGRTADGGRLASEDYALAYPTRLTTQLTRRDRVTGLFDWTRRAGEHHVPGSGWLGPAVTAPEATNYRWNPHQLVAQGKWTSTLSSKLLLETGYNFTRTHTGLYYDKEVVPATCFVAFALCPAGTNYGSIAKRDTLLGYEWSAASLSGGTGGAAGPAIQPGPSHYWTSSLSYVTGTQVFKVGFQHRSGARGQIREGITGDLQQLYRNGVPFAVDVFNTPVTNSNSVNHDLGVFVQTTYTRSRLTLNPGLRWDYFNASIPVQTSPAGRFVPERRFEEVKNVPNWHNVSPRFGASYDLTGRGRTAVRGHIGWYVEGQGIEVPARYNPMVFAQDNRTWNDLNGDDIAQENELGPSTNLQFGQVSSRRLDPDTKRGYQILYSLGVSHEVLAGLGLSVSYHKRDFHNLDLLRNLAIPLDQYTLYTVRDPRGDGETLPVYSVNRAVFGLVDQVDSNSEHNSESWSGVDVTVNGRLRGATFTAGTSTGRTSSVTCEVDNPNSLRFCDQTQYDLPFQTLFKASGTSPLPYGFRVSAVFQSQAGSERSITYQVTRALLPQLTQASVNVRLNEPGSEYNDRVNQLDVTLAKSFRRAGVDVRPELALFNALNASPILAQTNTFGPNLGRVTSILRPRILRLGVSVKF
jgi:hypothetical protein